MTYKNAKNLHNEDEVILKKTGEVMSVVEISVKEKSVMIMCEDGNEYHHTEIR